MFNIRVHYPKEGGLLVLKTDVDWEQSIRPTRTIPDDVREFEIETDRPFLYFKPVLVAQGEERWSTGANYLAVESEGDAVDVYPNFTADSSCSVCELRSLEEFRYRVFLPPGYEENPLKSYAVLYMQDGQNLFFPGEAAHGEHWRVQETLEILESMNAIERVVVVGIYPRDRMENYTLPGYESYGRFVVERLKPTIDAEYRTSRDADTTAVMGSSLGGVVSFYLAWTFPEVFGMAACLSTTFGYRDDLRERVTRERKKDVRIYLDSGWPEDNFEATRSMRSLLVAKGFREGMDLHYFAFPFARHRETSWATRSHLPFQLFFGRRSGAASPPQFRDRRVITWKK